MKPVTDLYGAHRGDDIYVVGTGTSMRVFPMDALAGKLTIGLNRAWQLLPVQYAITLAPHTHVPEFLEGESPHPEITWVTKRGKAKAVLTPEQFADADRRFYTIDIGGRERSGDDWVTDEGRVTEWVRRPSGTMLYQWSSISQTAANLAANMGARTVILVGCDNTALLDNHHAREHHTKWLGKTPEERYRQYYEGLVEVRAALRTRGVNLVSVTPFLGLGKEDEDFTALCAELDAATFVPAGPDISETDHPRRFAAASAEPAPPSGIRQRVRGMAGPRARAVAANLRALGRGENLVERVRRLEAELEAARSKASP